MTAAFTGNPEERPNQPIPNTHAVSGLPATDQRSAKAMARYFWDQYQSGLSIRHHRDIAWMKLKLIMRGIHYFKVEGGGWKKIAAKPGEIRAVLPIMDPSYRRELGRVGGNLIGVTVSPQTAKGRNAFYMAERGQAILDNWIEEESAESVEDEANQQLLYFGMQAYHWYPDPFKQRMCLFSIPGPCIFPIPYTATRPEDADGIAIVRPVGRAWLEQQDDLLARRLGHRNFSPMAREASDTPAGLYARSPYIASPDQAENKADGALTIQIYMKPTPFRPHGESIFMVNERIYAYHATADQEYGAPLPGGRVPLAFTYYRKSPDEWWGYGFCENLISMQLEANRQWTTIVRNAKLNKPLVFYDPSVIDPKSVHSNDDALIPFKANQYEADSKPVLHFPAPASNRDVGAVLQIVNEFAQRTAGHDSPVTMGDAPGRIEGGPAINVVQQNAQAPLQPVFSRKFRAWKDVYRQVLDGLRGVWPDQKLVRVTGQQNLGREIMLSKDDIPWSHEVVIRPTPFLLNGSSQMVAMLMQLRQMPGQDGVQGSEIKTREFRRSLRLLDAAPPGLDLVDRAEQRIQWRIGMLIGDGRQPAIAPAGAPGTQHLVMEDHRLAVQMLKDVILDPAFSTYGPAVKQALVSEIAWHQGQSNPIPTNLMDDSIQRFDARAQEAYFDGLEQDIEDASLMNPAMAMP